MSKARMKAYFALIMVAAIWGIASPVIKYTLEGFSPIMFLTYRFAISSVIAIVTFSFAGWHLPKNTFTFLKVILYGLLTSTVSLGLLFFGINNTTVLDSALITLVVPLAVTEAGVRFLHEHVTKRERIGIAIALLGTVLTVLEPIAQNGEAGSRLLGNLLLLGYVGVTVFATVLGKRLLRLEVRPLTLTNFSFILGFLTLLPFAALSASTFSFSDVKLSYHMGVLYMALFSGSLAYYLSNKAQKTIEIGEQSLFSYLNPLFSIPLAVFWLGETITPLFIAGSVVVTAGVIIAETKKKIFNIF